MSEDPAVDFAFLVGQAVQEIHIWGPFRLIFERGDETEPEIYVDAQEARLSVGTETSTVSFFTDGDPPASAAALVSLMWQRVVAASEAEGALRLSFENGAELLAKPDADYESWTVVGDRRSFFCLPGGEVDSTG